MQPPLAGYPPYTSPPKDDTNELALNATFNAFEVIQELQTVLNNNITQPKIRQQIISDVSHSMIKNGWSKKIERLGGRLAKLASIYSEKSTQVSPSPDNIRENIKSELFDVIAFIQILGGLDPEKSEKSHIHTNFITAIQFLNSFIQQLKWPERPCPQIQSLRHEFYQLSTKTFTEILNRNINNFENQDALNKCLIMLIDLDHNYLLHQYLIPPLANYYRNLQRAVFKERMDISHISAGIKLSMRDDTNLIPQINALKPDLEGKKFILLEQKRDMGQDIEDAALKAALETKNINAICIAMEKFPGNKDVERHFYELLVGAANHWVNLVLKFPSENPNPNTTRSPFNDPIVLRAYLQFKKMLRVIGDEGRRKVLAVISASEPGLALRSLVARQAIDTSNDHEMARDIGAIIAPISG